MRRVSFTQSGGFVGVVHSCRIEVATLAAEERASLEQLVAASGLEASCECLSENCRDGRTYEIVIEHETSVVRAVFDDASLPEAARPLISFLKARATPGMPR